MESTLLQIGKQAIFPQKVQYPSHGFYVNLILIFSVDENVIQIHDDKDSELFYHDLVDIALKASRSVR